MASFVAWAADGAFVAEKEEYVGPVSASHEPGTRSLGRRVETAVRARIVGQDRALERILVALLAGGHVLLEGVPGLAKTLMVRSFAGALDVDFKRIQFTPDLLPSDVAGSLVYRPDRGTFAPSRGPIFANLVLADELNRAPAKVQSALLEAMEEGQVTLGGHPLELPTPFMVLATENPIEQQGTYPLAEAQLDRFLMMLKLGYPDSTEEKRILRAAADGSPVDFTPVATGNDLLKARAEVESVMVQDALLDYVVEIVRATRSPASVGLPDLEGLIEFGASPRAGIGLVSASRALAFLRDRDYAVPDDVKDLAPDVLRHRLVLTYEAVARAVDVEEVIASILSAVPVPR